ncbi:hypothetical protein [Streptomyces sp. NPDC093109]|uniref:hypothetical protein n=1 Tax=Streptomyces sp. NPDC093109 TaxID=3154977 RepID=UPI00345036BF
MNPTPETKTPETDAPDLTKSAAGNDAKAEVKDQVEAENKAEVTEVTEVTEVKDEDEADEDDVDEDAEDAEEAAPANASSGLGSAASAVLAVCLGIVALTGTWTSRVLAERQGLVGQLKTGQSATAEQQIAAIYGDAWHVTAAVNGGVALVALIIGAIVLALPVGRTAWVRPFALAGAVLGFLGLLTAVAMYFDLFAAMPTTSS